MNSNQEARQSVMRPGGPRGSMGRPIEKAGDSKAALVRLVRYLAGERRMITGLLLMILVTVTAGVFAPRFQSAAIDKMVSRAFGEIPRLLAIMLLLYIAAGVGTLLQGFLSARLTQHVVKKLRSDLFHKIIGLPIGYIDRHPHGDLMSRMTSDAENVSNVISSSLGSLFSSVLTLVGTLVMMLTYSVSLTILTCVTIIGTVVVTNVLSRLMRRYYLKRQTLLGNLNGIVEEKITGCRTVTAYNLQDRVVDEFAQTSDALTKTAVKAEMIGSLMGPMMNMLNNISFVIVAVFGAWFAVKGYITVGVISAFTVYSKQFSRPVNEIAQLYGQIQTALAGAERIFAVMDIDSEDMSGIEESPVTDGTIEFSHVDFSYVPGKQVINDFNLRIEAGKKIALVGSTGCGKTTIVNLLMRFYDPDSGEIRIDGVKTTDISRKTLRNDVGIVLQESMLFTDTIRGNLKYADPALTDEAMMEAARISNCNQVALALPDGYDTVLTGAGSSLSQGQRQLLTIGRAFLSMPKFLILDEATSSVDTRTEKHIQDAMANLMKNRTSLIIAHRLSTIRDADQIIVMDQGRIVESGTHDELLARGGLYHSLYMTQFAGEAI